MKLHILAIAAHPDDIELGCAGTLLVHKRNGQQVGLIDLTRGEMGTRGTADLRDQEATAAAEVIDADVRENLSLPDTFFENDKESKLKVATKIRAYQPEWVITNAEQDRHPDHGRAAQLVEEAVFWSGLKRIDLTDERGQQLQPWRPKRVIHMIQSTSLTPHFYVDISDVYEQKMAAIRAYRSQFYDPDSQEPETYISTPHFMTMLESRAREYGERIGVQYAEGFTMRQFLGIRQLDDLL